MKVLIESGTGGKYLTEEGTWTTKRVSARDFRQSLLAIQYCISEKLLDVYVKLSFEDSRLDVRLDPFAAKSGGARRRQRDRKIEPRRVR